MEEKSDPQLGNCDAGQTSSLVSKFQLELLRLLGLVRMSRSRVDLQLGHLSATQAIARHHPADRLEQNAFRLRFEQVLGSHLLEAAGITGIPLIRLRLPLLAGEADLGSVRDHNKLAGILVGSVLGPMLAAKDVGNLDG